MCSNCVHALRSHCFLGDIEFLSILCAKYGNPNKNYLDIQSFKELICV